MKYRLIASLLLVGLFSLILILKSDEEPSKAPIKQQGTNFNLG